MFVSKHNSLFSFHVHFHVIKDVIINYEYLIRKIYTRGNNLQKGNSSRVIILNIIWSDIVINPLRPSSNYMNHLL
jgi:hypothetical protein